LYAYLTFGKSVLSTQRITRRSFLKVIRIQLRHGQRPICDTDSVFNHERSQSRAIDEHKTFDRFCEVDSLRVNNES